MTAVIVGIRIARAVTAVTPVLGLPAVPAVPAVIQQVSSHTPGGTGHCLRSDRRDRCISVTLLLQ
jgi:hypothetical protein